jgi:hypothetical protein
VRPALRERVLGAALGEPSPTRDERRGRGRAIGVLAVGVPLVVWVAIGAFAPLARGYLWASALAFFLVLAVALPLALRRGPTMLGPPTRSLALVAVLSGPVVLAWVVGCSYAWDLEAAPSPFGSHAVCFVFSNVLAAAPLAALVWARRGTDPVHPRATGAVIGLAAGAAGGLLMQLHCPWGSPLHAALGHALPMAVLALAGALLLARFVGIEHR